MKWHLYRHPKTHMEVKTDGNHAKHLKLILKGFKRINIVDYTSVNKGAK
jgi:hypothetical protein